MDFTVDIQNLDQLMAALKQAPSIAGPILQRAIDGSQALLAKYTGQNVPWRTGYLAKTWVWTPGTLSGTWAPSAKYAPFVQFGTSPHTILPTMGKALYWPGASHPVKIVHHPGTKAQPFMQKIIAAATPEINTLFGQALTQINAAIAAQA